MEGLISLVDAVVVMVILRDVFPTLWLIPAGQRRHFWLGELTMPQHRQWGRVVGSSAHTDSRMRLTRVTAGFGVLRGSALSVAWPSAARSVHVSGWSVRGHSTERDEAAMNELTRSKADVPKGDAPTELTVRDLDVGDGAENAGIDRVRERPPRSAQELWRHQTWEATQRVEGGGAAGAWHHRPVTRHTDREQADPRTIARSATQWHDQSLRAPAARTVILASVMSRASSRGRTWGV